MLLQLIQKLDFLKFIHTDDKLIIKSLFCTIGQFTLNISVPRLDMRVLFDSHCLLHIN